MFDKHLAANMNLLSPDEHRDLFSNAGFADVEIFEAQEKGWICAFGRKPFSGGVQIKPSA
jgi:hypothetical protein